MRRWIAFVAGALAGLLPGQALADVKIGMAPSLTGPLAFSGESARRTVEIAVADINAAGGVLGEPLRIVMVDDACEAEAAVVAARKLVAEGVAVVFGHLCSGAAIPASDIYEAAGIPMFAFYASSPILTERGLKYVFRLLGRVDNEAVLTADYLAAQHRSAAIAVIHDAQVVNRGLADYMREELKRRGMSAALVEELAPDALEFSNLVARIREANVSVLYCACFVQQGGLLIRQVWEGGLRPLFIGGNGMDNEDLGVIAGPAAEGMLIVNTADWTGDAPGAMALANRVRASGYDPDLFWYGVYAGVQAWAHAAGQTRSVKGVDLIGVLHSQRFDTVLGPIGWNEKGDIVGLKEWAWWRRRGGRVYGMSTSDLLQGRFVETPGQ